LDLAKRSRRGESGPHARQKRGTVQGEKRGGVNQTEREGRKRPLGTKVEGEKGKKTEKSGATEGRKLKNTRVCV